MFNVILACTKNFGIGNNNNMPWYCKDELQLFKEKTKDSIVICGRKTYDTLPYLKDRTVICVTKQASLSNIKSNVILVNSLEKAFFIAKEICNDKKIYVIGGKQIYEQCFSLYLQQIGNIHVSFMRRDYPCDIFVNLPLSKLTISSFTSYEEFDHYEYIIKESSEKQYLNLLSDIIRNGDEKIGRNGKTLSLFGKNLSFDLREGFPLLTTKKMFFKGIVEELLFFIKGETNSKILEDKGVNIWKGNTSVEFLKSINKERRKEGMMGPLYGYQWRYFNAEYDEETGKPKNTEKSVDQLRNVIDTIKTDPFSRRILLTDYNPLQASQGVLYPCHSIIIQFNVCGDFLDMFCYNRSQDMFLGVPFNIASSSLLLILIAKVCSLIPRNLHMSMGDCHIYEEHISVAKEQIERIPFTFCNVEILQEPKNLEDLCSLKIQDFSLVNYRSHSSLKGKMIP